MLGLNKKNWKNPTVLQGEALERNTRRAIDLVRKFGNSQRSVAVIVKGNDGKSLQPCVSCDDKNQNFIVAICSRKVDNRYLVDDSAFFFCVPCLESQHAYSAQDLMHNKRQKPQEIEWQQEPINEQEKLGQQSQQASLNDQYSGMHGGTQCNQGQATGTTRAASVEPRHDAYLERPFLKRPFSMKDPDPNARCCFIKACQAATKNAVNEIDGLMNMPKIGSNSLAYLITYEILRNREKILTFNDLIGYCLFDNTLQVKKAITEATEVPVSYNKEIEIRASKGFLEHLNKPLHEIVDGNPTTDLLNYFLHRFTEYEGKNAIIYLLHFFYNHKDIKKIFPPQVCEGHTSFFYPKTQYTALVNNKRLKDLEKLDEESCEIIITKYLIVGMRKVQDVTFRDIFSMVYFDVGLKIILREMEQRVADST